MRENLGDCWSTSNIFTSRVFFFSSSSSFSSLQSFSEEESELQSWWHLYLVCENASTVSELYVDASGKIGTFELLNKSDDFSSHFSISRDALVCSMTVSVQFILGLAL